MARWAARQHSPMRILTARLVAMGRSALPGRGGVARRPATAWAAGAVQTLSLTPSLTRTLTLTP